MKDGTSGIEKECPDCGGYGETPSGELLCCHSFREYERENCSRCDLGPIDEYVWCPRCKGTGKINIFIEAVQRAIKDHKP